MVENIKELRRVLEDEALKGRSMGELRYMLRNAGYSNEEARGIMSGVSVPSGTTEEIRKTDVSTSTRQKLVTLGTVAVFLLIILGWGLYGASEVGLNAAKECKIGVGYGNLLSEMPVELCWIWGDIESEQG